MKITRRQFGFGALGAAFVSAFEFTLAAGGAPAAKAAPAFPGEVYGVVHVQSVNGAFEVGDLVSFGSEGEVCKVVAGEPAAGVYWGDNMVLLEVPVRMSIR